MFDINCIIYVTLENKIQHVSDDKNMTYILKNTVIIYIKYIVHMNEGE